MPRKSKRITLAKGIYRNGPDGTYEVRVTVGGETYAETMPKDSTLDELKAKRASLENQGRTDTPRAERGTLRADADRYLKLVTHLTSWKERKAHLDAWCVLYGDLYRHRLKESDVLAAREQWRETMAPKTINHRVDTLRNLFHRLDGRKAPTPCDEVRRLTIPKTIIQRVSEKTILAVDRNLQQHERQHPEAFHGAKTRARFRVFVSTGKRPIEIMRAQPGDVNLKARVWVPRDAKGGFCAGVYLNDDQLAAWKLFIKANAWGTYSLGSFGRTIRAAGWPKDLRPYQARHSTWIAASERGIDLEDIAAGAGHTDPRMTRRMYVPVLNSRLQRLGEALEGRFQGWPMVPKSGTAKSPKRAQRK